MVQQLIVFADIIVTYVVALAAAGYNFEVPIQWASGTKNPFYIDNRKLISDPKARGIIRKALASLVKYVDITDYIYGIPKAGIAPATLLAMEIDRRLLIKIDDKYYSFRINSARELIKRDLTDLMKSADVIAGTAPLGIILGIIIAEELGKPFLFVRQEPKDHGLKNQVEGIVHPGDFALLVDPVFSKLKMYTVNATRALQTSEIKTLTVYSPNIEDLIEEVNVKGKKIIGQEDLVSTGESCLNEILQLMSLGANVKPQSIFSYNLPTAVDNFKKHGLVNESVYNFEDLMAEYARQQKFSLEVTTKIWEWYNDQPKWGDKNGFPAVKK